jgi:two-component system osmolarity sensor histidine kinase EnvZ
VRLLPRTLLWRTVVLIAVLLIVALTAAIQVLRLSEREPRARQIARQVASVVNLTRSALITAAPEKRRGLLADLSEMEGIRIYPADEDGPPAVRLELPWMSIMQDELQRLLGSDTRAVFVPGDGGRLWVSFKIDDDTFWLVIPRGRFEHPFAWRWLGWITALLALAIVGAYLIVARVNRPLRRLTTAAARVGRGERLEPLVEDGPAEVRELTRAFNQMAADLAHLDADRKLLLAGVSHDLRTPLSRLRLAVEMLPDERDDTTKLGMVQDIEDMDAVIGQFTAFVREGEGEQKAATDLDALVRACLERYTRAGRTIDTRLAPLPKLPLRATAMQRLIANLVDNALKYGIRAGASDAEVEVHTWQQGERVYLSVLDRGPGIPSGSAPRLMQAFTRLDTSRANSKGSGLGLAIVDRIARSHGGSVSLLARTGGGLEARVELPV